MSSAKDGRASESVLAELHGAIARALEDRLASGAATTADINAAIKFLKDNGIDCVGKENPNLNDLTEGLPTYEELADGEEMKLMH